MISGVVLAIFLWLAGAKIAALFDPQPSVVAVAVLYFVWVPLSYGAAAMVMIMNAAFNGLGRPMPAVAVSVGRMIFLFLPLAWLGKEYFGLAGIFGALMIANIVSGFGAYWWLRNTVKNDPTLMPQVAG